MTPSRRTVLAATGAVGLGAAAPKGKPGFDDAWHQAVLERFASFGVKASGGQGDNGAGAWLEGELTRLGYSCERQVFQTPYFEARQATLSAGAAKATVIPQAIVVPTGPGGLAAPLRLASAPDLAGAIAVIVLPYKRWVSLVDPQVARPIAEAFQRGAAAAVAVTTGPTGEAIALNVSPRRAGFDRPVAILAPKEAAPFVAAAAKGEPGVLTVDGAGGRRDAWNLIARLDRGAPKTLILSTPRSGWFTCAAERGSGVAVWLSLAHALAAGKHKANLELLATSGHEYEYFGGEEYLQHRAPPPAKARMWVHIGASAAGRDWIEFGGALRPLPSADSQRVLTATPEVVDGVRRAFKGITGLEATLVADNTTAGGELVNVLKAGYAPAIGLYGGHRYFHTAGDDMRCVSGDLVRPVAEAFRRAVLGALA